MKVMANLNGILLCPFQVIIDILEQLNINKTPFSQLLFQPICKLEEVSHWVDLDSLGDPVALRAYELSSLLALALSEKNIDALDLTIFLGNAFLEIDNYYALLTLARLLEGKLKVTLFIDDELKEALAFYVEPSTHEKLTIEIRSSSFLVEEHQPLQALKKMRYQLLKHSGFDFFDSVTGEINTSNFKFDSSFIRYVWTALKGGSYPVSTRLLKYVLNQKKLSEPDQESLLMHLQHIHFLSHQHEVVIQQDYPSSFKFQLPEIIINLYFIKAFSATLLRRFDIAKDCFHLAGIHLTMPLVDENSLYQLNLLALYYLLKGDTDTAFMLEKKLNDFIEKNQIKTIAINYVVLINIARLYKKARKLDQSFIFYEKAYQQIREGGFTHFDSMYYNMDKAGIYESSEQYPKALTSWIKVALYWLSSANPYSLALKPRVVLCQEKVTETLAPLCTEKVTQFLVEKITALSEKLGYTFKLSNCPQQRLLSSNQQHSKDTAYLAEDILIYGCEAKPCEQVPPLSAVENKLHSLILSLIKEHLKIEIKENAVLIEGLYENNSATSWHNHIALAALQGCSDYYWNERRFEQTDIQIINILAKTQLRLSKMILSSKTDPESIQFLFKRNFLNQTISSKKELAIIEHLLKGPTSFTASGTFDSDSIIALLHRNVIEIEPIQSHALLENAF